MADLLCDTRRWCPPVVSPSSLRARHACARQWERAEAEHQARSPQRSVRSPQVRKLNPAEAAADAHGCHLACRRRRGGACASARESTTLTWSRLWSHAFGSCRKVTPRTLLSEEVSHVVLRDCLAQTADSTHVHCAHRALRVHRPVRGCAGVVHCSAVDTGARGERVGGSGRAAGQAGSVPPRQRLGPSLTFL